MNLYKDNIAVTHYQSPPKDNLGYHTKDIV